MTHRRQRGHPRLRKTRLARFEQLEPRYYLSAASNLAIPTNSDVQQTPSVVVDQLGQPPAISNQAITTDAGVQQMPSVAVDPLDANHVVIAYMDYSLPKTKDGQPTGYAGIGVAVSTKGGDIGTWGHTFIPLPVGFDQGAANPVVKFDNGGNVYVVFMAATFKAKQPPITNPSGTDNSGANYRSYGFTANNGIFLSRSNDGGLTWESPAAVDQNIFDDGTPEHHQTPVPFDVIPDLAIDTFHTTTTSTGEDVNQMYVTFSRYYPAGQYPGEPDSVGGSNIMIAVSIDGGRNWQLQLEDNADVSPVPMHPIRATVIYNAGLFRGTGNDISAGIGLENWAHVAVGRDGDVYVSQFAGAQFVVHHSTNGGASFTHPDKQTGALYPFGVNVPVIPGTKLTENSFRLQTVRAIAADPVHPGTVYVAEARPTTDPQGTVLDEGDVVFARSDDYGSHWTRTFQLGGTSGANVVNDENDGVKRKKLGVDDDVAAPQALPRLVTGADGSVALAWYDTRRDLANHLLDVFATVALPPFDTSNQPAKLDFSPNFRLTDQSFDADAGAFTDAIGKTDYYLGDAIGLALGDHVMYAAWTGTDTRQGNQDIYFRRISLTPTIPAPPNDRFEPNDDQQQATELGTVVERDLPKLATVVGDEDWFRLETAATGSLTVAATLASPGAGIRLELYNGDGTTLLATGNDLVDGNGQITAESLSVASPAKKTYLVHVLPGQDDASADPVRYTLSLKSLTANLGAHVSGALDGSLADGDSLYYALQAPAAGSLEVSLIPGADAQGNFKLELLDGSNPANTLADAQQTEAALHVSLAVVEGQKVYVHVSGDADAHGKFSLSFANLDQFTTEANKTAFIPTALGPSEEVMADVNLDGKPDIVVSHVGDNIVSVILNNGDGTFQAPREFAVGAFQQGGPFTLFGVPNYHRDLAVANFNPNKDSFPDILAVNPSSGDVSLLLGNGDGTFQPQRRFDATDAGLAVAAGDTNASSVPFALAIGDVNNDGNVDMVLVDSSDVSTAQVAVRLSRRDGTFQPPTFFTFPNRETNRTNAIRLADVDGDGKLDLIERDFVHGTTVFLGGGDGTFQLQANPIQSPNGPGLLVANVDDDPNGTLDVVTTHNNSGSVEYALGNGKGSFATPATADVGQFPVAVAVGDFGRQLSDGSIGPPDGHSDLIVADNGAPLAIKRGPAEIVMLPGLYDKGQFTGFGDPIRLASAQGPLDVKLADLNGDGILDVVVVDRSGILVIYGQRPQNLAHDSLATARDLGTVVHVVEPTLTIVPGHTNAYYKLVVPTEASASAGDQILDFSGGFADQDGPGLAMEVLDAAGNPLEFGERLRIAAHQGDTLFVHIFAKTGVAATKGGGAYTLVVDTLPRVTSVEAPSLLPGVGNLPGGPTTNIIVGFQGDRLDPQAAEDPTNYTVTWLGPDGVRGGGDDQVIQVGSGLDKHAKPVIYDPGSNIDVSSGLTFPTAVRQTVTLSFGQPLPAGNYEIQVSPRVISASFNEREAELLTPRAGFTGHSVVTNVAEEGAVMSITNLVQPPAALGSFSIFQSGNRFLIQFHGDIGALLDSLLTAEGDQPITINEQISTTDQLLLQVIAQFAPALFGPTGQPIVPMLVGLLDPVSFGLVDPEGRSLTYDLRTNEVANKLHNAFVEVGGNIELVVIVNPAAEYHLNVADVPAQSRGGFVYFGAVGAQELPFTDALRDRQLNVVQSFSGLKLTAGLVPSVTLASQLGEAALLAAAQSETIQRIGAPTSTANVAASSTVTLTNLRLLSGLLLSDAVAVGQGGSGGSTPGGPRDKVQRAWDELSTLWDELDSELVGNDPVGVDKLPIPSGTARLVHVWHALQDIVNNLVTAADASESAAAHRREPAQHDVAKPNSDQVDVPTEADSADADQANSAAATDNQDTNQASTEPTARDGGSDSALPANPSPDAVPNDGGPLHVATS